jgi:hypothetical protein
VDDGVHDTFLFQSDLFPFPILLFKRTRVESRVHREKVGDGNREVRVRVFRTLSRNSAGDDGWDKIVLWPAHIHPLIK